MSGKKIQDNSSYAKIINLASSVEALAHLYRNIPKLKEQYPELQKTFDELATKQSWMDAAYIPDRFNDRFSSSGWIAYESLPIDTAKEAIRIHDESGIIEADNYLANAYDEKFLTCASRGFHSPKAFSSRLRLINLAKTDYLEERYHACIPLLLSLLDGIVNDVTKSVGFFAGSADLTAWDSVAAHSSGLQALTSLLSKGRGITTEDKITIPYRNGILHGRDLAFDNKIVAAKCWAALFAIKDWADAICEGKKNKIIEKELSWSELTERKIKREQINKLFEDWTPRQPNQLNHFPITDSSDAIPKDTPEHALWRFLDNWKNNRYGLMADLLLHCQNAPRGKCAGSVKDDYSKLKLTSFEIVSTIDETPSSSRFKVTLHFPENNTDSTISLFYLDSEGYNYVRSCDDGQWRVLQASFSKILFPQ